MVVCGSCFGVLCGVKAQWGVSIHLVGHGLGVLDIVLGGVWCLTTILVVVLAGHFLGVVLPGSFLIGAEDCFATLLVK